MLDDPCFQCKAAAEHRHHVVPQSRGGTETVPLCITCHQKVHDLSENWSKRAYIHPTQHQAVVVSAQGGCTAASIAKDLGLSYTAVLRIIKEAGVPLQKGRRAAKESSVAGAPTGRHGVSDVSLRITQRAMKVAVNKQIHERGEKQRSK